MSQYQVMKRSAYAYEVLCVQAINAPVGSNAHRYELMARIVLDPLKDVYFVEKPVWNDKAYAWHRIEKPYIVFQAAFNAIVSPKAPD